MAVNAEAGASTSRTGNARVAVQKFGTFLSGMIMPNIAAFIAWGFITAFFIETGWTPVGGIGGFGTDANGEPNIGLVGPMIRFMLPLLIAIQGGRMVYGIRGSVVAAVATMGVIISTTDPNFLGALIMGPLAAWCMKHVDKLWEGKIKPGFEMLVNNFSAGILAAALAVVGFFLFGPPIEAIATALGDGVDWLVDNSLLPLASLIIEPAKVLFLNNAINHGVLTPLGIQQAAEEGKSILFLLEANPGPGAGLLIAYAIFGTGVARNTAPDALITQSFGGIHEVYFPYALMKPVLILALIGGGMTGVTTNMLLGGALRAPAAPGSIIAVLAQTSSGAYLAVILSVILSATVTFLIAWVILRASRKRDLEAMAATDDAFGAAITHTEAAKGKSSEHLGGLRGGAATETGGGIEPATMTERDIKSIVFACD